VDRIVMSQYQISWNSAKCC